MNWEVKTMQLKTSFFNGSLYKKNILRFWPLWAAVSLMGSLMPLALLLRAQPMSLMDTKDLYYTVLTTAAPLIGIGYALPCAIAVWSYLHQSKSVGMMHSLPIRRESLFVTSALSGMTMFLIPYVIVGAMTILVTCMRGEVAALPVLQAMGACAGDGLLFFAIATLAAMVSGSAFMAIALYFVWNFLAVLVEALYNAYAGGFLFGVSSAYLGKLNFLSPVVGLMSKVQTEHVYYETPEGLTRTKDILLQNYWIVGVYALVGVALLVGSYLLYRRRHSETAGDAVAVKPLRPVFLYAAAAVSAMAGGVVFYTLLFSDVFRGVSGGYFEGYRLFPMLLCMALGSFLGYFGARMILKKTTHVFDRKGLLGCSVMLLACIVFCVGMKLDIFGVAKRVPAADEVRSARVIVESMDAELTGEDEALLRKMLSAHTAVTENLELIREHQRSAEENVYFCNFRVSYELNDGKTLARDYLLPLSEDGRFGAYEDAVKQLGVSEEFLLRAIHADDASYVPEGGDFYQPEDDSYYELDEKEAQQLIDALAADICAGCGGHFYADTFEKGYAFESKGSTSSNIDISYRRAEEGGERYAWDNITVWDYEGLPATAKLLSELAAMKSDLEGRG